MERLDQLTASEMAAWCGAGLATVVFPWNIIAWCTSEKIKKKRYDLVDKESRIKRVYDEYMDLLKTRQDAGPHGLLDAGVANLKSSAEIEELAEMIKNHGQLDPLHRHSGIYENVDFLIFYKYCAREKVHLCTQESAELVEQSGARKPKPVQ